MDPLVYSSAGFGRAIKSGLARQVACLTAWPDPPRSNCIGGRNRYAERFSRSETAESANRR